VSDTIQSTEAVGCLDQQTPVDLEVGCFDTIHLFRMFQTYPFFIVRDSQTLASHKNLDL
jgi:hypothetical protein